MFFQKPASIKNFQIMGEYSYANSVLQAFIQLECVQEWIKYLTNNNRIYSPYYNSTLTKELYQIFCSLSNYNNLDSSKTILDFENKFKQLWMKNLPKDPFHFLFYFLEILHYENNIPKNPNFDMAFYNQMIINNLRMDNQMTQLFSDYLEQTQNSFISQNFYNIQKFIIACPNCQFMYSYAHKKIIRFDLDYILALRNQNNPLKKGTVVSLCDCFIYSQMNKKSQCNLCANIFSNEKQALFESSNVLICAFNRKLHPYKYRGDLKFYLDFDISQYILKKGSDNKKYKLKAVISCYDYNKYLVNVFINGNYYRIVDWKNNNDVKLITTNQLMEYEPILLIYEIDYQGRLYQQFLKLMTIAQMAKYAQMMAMNMNLSMNPMPFQNMNDSAQNITLQYLTLKFVVIPQNWDGSNDSSFPINPQVIMNYTVKEAIDKFYSKLAKPKEAIIKFTYNGQNLDPNSEQKLKDLNINEHSIIYAIKSPNYDDINFQNY